MSDFIQEDISVSIWRDKYRNGDERSIHEMNHRVMNGVYANDLEHGQEAFEAMDQMLWCPGGRILAGAGTKKRVTLINCYVNETVEDSMEGIMHALNTAAFTQQMGGGIGTDFSTIRPKGAIVKRTGSVSSGILPFMDMWDSMCKTIKSSGSRRGAMMGTLACWHPDILDFVKAKNEKKRLNNFNVSVLVTDDFMKAVKEDKDWELGFNVSPSFEYELWKSKESKTNHTLQEGWQRLTGQDPSDWYIYHTIRARKLWDLIIRNTYEYAEPGVMFVDRINSENNLQYCEYIHCSNPCGEQPLPPNGDCNLGAVNLAKLVKNPFDNPEFDFKALLETTQIGMRFLDNVLDVSQFPCEEQKTEALNKRRTGIGIMGLGNALQQMKLRYGSKEAVEITGAIMMRQRDAAYSASIALAKERGPFPLFDKDSYLKAPYIKRLPAHLRDAIAQHGIRNGVIQTIAPTGTTSILYDNVSSGIEPTFAWKHYRKVLQSDNSFAEFPILDYGYKKYCEFMGYPEVGEVVKFPDYMVTATELTVDDHLKMQAACQEFIDASISKTINCPKEMSFEDFKEVYSKAYSMGLKGCTTYRPSDVRGSVLSIESQEKKTLSSSLITRPKKLSGTTYKVKWPKIEQAFYVTINDCEQDGKKIPFEIFINSKSVQHQEWIAALTRCISAVFRKSSDATFIVEELMQVFSASGGVFIDGGYVPSLVAMIGKTIEEHFISIGLIQKKTESYPEGNLSETKPAITVLGEICPKCSQPTLFKQEGCEKCSCGYSTCG